MIILQYTEDQAVFDIVLYHFMLQETRIKKIAHEYLSDFTGLCTFDPILLSI